jgi:hypothetical protein
MRQHGILTACGLALTLGWGTLAGAQNNGLDSFGAYYPVPGPAPMTPGGTQFVPRMPASVNSYGYVTVAPGYQAGMSPSTYYSPYFFTNAPSSVRPYAYNSPTYSPYTYNSGYAGVYRRPTAPTQMVYRTAPVVTTPTTASYARANTTYYQARRGGPLRRLFGGR